MDDHTPDVITLAMGDGYTVIVDPQDADLLKLKLRLIKTSRNAYAHTSIDGKSIGIHRLVLARILGRPLTDTELPDHVNCNGLDNRRCNLRQATQRENMRNKRRYKNNRSGFKGVYQEWKNHRWRWRAAIVIDGKQLSLGRFDTPEEAHEAYKAAANKYFGEFARFE